MIKLLRSGKAFSEALSRINEISQKGAYSSAEAKELQLLKWLVNEYEDRFSCYNSTELESQPLSESQKLKIAYGRAD